ncbi:MAG: hypothetical protein LUQ50_11745 [Methanospirillum sp.]|uniref:two-CW domain-containing protein n=1 Tax=Methanospirillum sp. TaxID=45200 RepID=UPI00236AEFA9|nr:hypothetical protein [Methanospirillum sp.]MDD1729728.1 hypothetical protein [Methanospirillum sp.]
MNKLNCWEYKKCGRQPGGEKTEELGVCPAATESRTNGVNSELHGGRACWAITGTFCGGKVQGTHAQKLGNCLTCEFYKEVQREERPDFKTAGHILSLIRNTS